MTAKLRKQAMMAMTGVLLAASGMMVEPLQRSQVDYDLTHEPVKGIGPGMVLATTALGAFRGIIVDVVWIRMENLKQEGKFFELVQLADLACKLAPRFPAVWDLNAWNLAWNVSVQVPVNSERWPWVKKGIEVLRDEAIPLNPGAPELYFNLSFIYLNKIGADIDEAHFWYKSELGLEMHEVLGGGGSAMALRVLAYMPKTKGELLADPALKPFYDRCLAIDFDPLRENSEEGALNIFVWMRRQDAFPKAVNDLLASEENRPFTMRLINFARARRLEKMHLDPRKMMEIMMAYGDNGKPAPFDWRSPYPHAIYWARQGLEEAKRYRLDLARRRRQHGLAELPEEHWDTGFQKSDYHEIRYDRCVYTALQFLVTKGRILYDSRGRMLPMMGPDFRFTDVMVREFDKALEAYGTNRTYFRGVRSAYLNVLDRATLEFFFRGDLVKAKRYYQMLREKFPDKEKHPADFQKFINDRMIEFVERMDAPRCRNILQGLLRQHYYYLGAGEDERATGIHERARAIERYWKRIRGDTLRVKVDFEKLRETVLLDIFAGQAGFPRPVFEGLKNRLSPGLVRQLEQGAREMMIRREGAEAVPDAPE